MIAAGDLFNVRRAVVSVTPLPDGCWLVELACGHKEEWSIDPPTGSATCKACLAVIVERLNAL